MSSIKIKTIETTQKHLITHYGRNTHFRRICSSVPNFNFKYVYMKFEKLRDNRHIFEEIMQKLARRENYASEEIKFKFFFIILQVTTSIIIVYLQATIK